MFIQFSGKCGQKHEIMDKKNEIVDKNFESTYEHLSEPRNIHTNTVHIFWVDSNVYTNSQKVWTILFTLK